MTIGGTLVFATYLLVWSLFYCAPLLLMVSMMRHRIRPLASAIVVSMGFAAATAVTIYKVEWFDMFRHGMPPVRYLVRWLPWVAPYAALGWFMGYGLTTPTKFVKAELPKRGKAMTP